MAMATRQPTDALNYELVPEIWSARVINHVRRSLVAEQVVDLTWTPLLTKGDVITIPILAEQTGQDVDVSSDAVLDNIKATTTASSTETITIDTWWECAVGLDDATARQTQVGGLLEKMADNAGYTWQKKLDGDTTALFQSLTGTGSGTDGQTFTDDLLLTIMEGLDETDIPVERNLVCDPSTVADLRKIDKFMSFDYSNNPLRLAGYRGMIDPYGLPVFMTNNLTATNVGNFGAVLNKEAIAMVVQSPMDIKRWYENRRHSNIVNTSGFYGVDVVRPTFGTYFYTRSY